MRQLSLARSSLSTVVTAFVAFASACDRLADNSTRADEGIQTAFTAPPAGIERTFVDPPDSLVVMLGRLPHGLGQPVSAKVSAQGHVYVVDFGDRAVKQFTIQGDFVRSYGKGEGEGPGEFQAITDADVDREGHVWALDPIVSRLQEFDTLGNVVRTVKLTTSAYRFDRLPGDNFIVLTLDSLLFGAL